MTQLNVQSYLQELSHLPTFDEIEWPSLSLESQYLPKDSWNSGSIKVNFHFWMGHGTDTLN